MRCVLGEFEIDREGGRLSRAGQDIAIERRVLDLLCYLIEHPSRLITKDELLAGVWNAHALSESALSSSIAKLRKLLGQPARTSLPIETVHGRGYRFHPPTANIAAVSAPRSCEPFVGRTQVMQLLRRCLEQGCEGRGQLVLLTGEAGVGKTATLQQLIAHAADGGYTVWQGAAYADSGAPAYWPWIELVRAIHAESAASWHRHLPQDTWALSALVPELLGPAQTPVEPRVLRFRLFDELTRLIAALSGDGPRLIAIEDAHWADSASLELLEHLVRGLTRQPVVFAVTLREHSALAALPRLTRLAVHCPLQGLALAEVSELVELRAGKLEAGCAELIYLRSQGNPFFIQQLLQLISQRGQRVDRAALLNVELPPVVRDLIRERTHGLGADTATALGAAAVLGACFHASLLAQLLERTLPEVLAALEPALQRGLVRYREAEPHSFELTHVLVRETLYDSLDLRVRGSLHRRVARLLERQAGPDDARILTEIAYHEQRALPVDLDACVRSCRNAAEAARRACCFDDAAAFLQTALAKLAAEGGDRSTRCELLLPLGFDLICAGDVRAGMRALEQGARLARQLERPELLVRFTCVLVDSLNLAGENIERVQALIDDLLGDASEAQPALRAILLARRAALSGGLPPAERRLLFQEAESLAADSGKDDVVLEVAFARLGERDPSVVDETGQALERYRTQLARRHGGKHELGDHMRRFTLMYSQYVCSLTQADLHGADRALSGCERAASAAQIPQMRNAVELMRAGRALGDGRLDDVCASVERLRSDRPRGGGLGLAWLFFSLLLAEAREDTQALLQLQSELDPEMLTQLGPSQRAGALIWLARVCARLDKPELARLMLTQVPREQRLRRPTEYGDLGRACSLAETQWLLRDPRDALALYEVLEPYAVRNAVGVALEYSGSVEHYLGLLALLLDRPSHAVRHLRRALEVNAQLGMSLQLERTRTLLAPLERSA